MAKHKKQGPAGAIQAKDVDVNYYSVCGLLFLLGAAVFIFMIVMCFRAKNPGAAQMMALLDAVETVFCLYLFLAWLRLRSVTKRNLGFSRAAVDRRDDDIARLEFPVGSKHYYIDVPKSTVGEAGMVNVWYDPKKPENIFVTEKKPTKPSPFGLANMSLLITLTVIVNIVFFAFLR